MENKKKFNWEDVEKILSKIAKEIILSKEEYSGIVAISRGGLPAATMLSHLLDIPIVDVISIESYKGNHQLEIVKVSKSKIPLRDRVNQRYLIVDDIADTGRTLLEMKNLFKFSHSVVVLQRIGSKVIPTYIGEKLKESSWIIFPWELDKIK